jgi:hypothetical protein
VWVEEVVARRVSIALATVVCSVRIEMRLDTEVDVVLAIVIVAAVANVIVYIESVTAAMFVG